jgi:hypothetical protein
MRTGAGTTSGARMTIGVAGMMVAAKTTSPT